MADTWSSCWALSLVWIGGWPDKAWSHLRPARAFARGCSIGWAMGAQISWRSGQIAELRPALFPEPLMPSSADLPGEAH